MKAAPTLADEILRASFGRPWAWFDPERTIQHKLPMARKFVLDASMSAFLADLAWASTLTCAKSKVKTQKLMDSMRKLSRLPHRLTWIEFDNIAKVKRVNETYGQARTMEGYVIDADTAPSRHGWLIEQHPQIETAFRSSAISSHALERGYAGWETASKDPSPNAHTITWCSEDHPLPWPSLIETSLSGDRVTTSGALTGMRYYMSPYVGITPSALVSAEAYTAYRKMMEVDLKEEYGEVTDNIRGMDIFQGCAGELRYIWALLSTINTLPVSNKFVTASKGYVAKGRYRKFVDHAVITLNIPETRYRRIAAHAIAAARRRAHEVRGHWRKDWRHPGERIWIHEHQRGDASLGFVTHDYEVKHEVAP